MMTQRVVKVGLDEVVSAMGLMDLWRSLEDRFFAEENQQHQVVVEEVTLRLAGTFYREETKEQEGETLLLIEVTAHVEPF